MADTIVCGVDKSDATGPVTDVARRLATALSDRLIVAHFVEEPPEEAEELVASLRGSMVENEGADVRLEEGPPAERLLEIADEEGAELLIVGSRGRRSLGRAGMGSVPRRLARDARCPVVVVPPATGAPAVGTDGDGASVVCGVDGSGHALSAAQVAGRLADELGYRVVVVHALQDVKAVVSYPGARATTPPVTGQADAVGSLADEIVDEAVRSLPVDATAIVEQGPPAEVLEAVAEREDGRLVVIAARGMGAVRAALLGSVAGSLAASATRPVVLLSEVAELALAEPTT